MSAENWQTPGLPVSDPPGNLQDKRTQPSPIMASKKKWVCWDWTMLPKFVGAKDEVDVGHMQERTSVGSIWIQPKRAAGRRQAT